MGVMQECMALHGLERHSLFPGGGSGRQPHSSEPITRLPSADCGQANRCPGTIFRRGLFHRHAQGLTLTDEGRGILGVAESMEEAARNLLRGCSGENEILGSVRVASPKGLATHVIVPRLLELHKNFLLLDVTLLPSSVSADLIHGEADIAVRLFRPVEGLAKWGWVSMAPRLISKASGCRRK